MDDQQTVSDAALAVSAADASATLLRKRQQQAVSSSIAICLLTAEQISLL